MNLNDRIRQFPLLNFDAFYELPWLPAASLVDGDVLVETCDVREVYGRLIYKTGLADMMAKKIPYAVQHTMTKTTVDGQPRKLEAVTTVSENPLDDETNKPFLILRSRTATPEQHAQAIAHGRTKLGQLYGVEQVAIKGLSLWWPWANLQGDDNDNPFCSFLSADMTDHGGYPLPGFGGDSDHKAAPWDWVTEKALEAFEIVGRGGRKDP